jgi:transglutaminase-like putative cysteine protease
MRLRSSSPRIDPPLLWSGVSLLLAVGLHLLRLPAWIIGMFLLLVLWRAVLALRHARLPSRPLRIAVLLVLVFAVWGAFRTLNGLSAGTALLSLMAGLKLLETRSARDYVVVILICYFLVLAAFLHEQSLWLLPVHAGVVWVITTALMRATQGATTLSAGAAARFSGRMLLQATPLMIALFILFPRVPGPFWALPENEGAVSGLGEEMSPGDISELSLSSEVAFRVRFDGAAPPPAARYWRGPVLHDFDGYTWRRQPGRMLPTGALEFSGAAYDYTLMLEPLGRDWVFALDMPEIWVRSQIGQRFDYQLVARGEPARRAGTSGNAIVYKLRSRTAYRSPEGSALRDAVRRIDLQLPAGRNPRTAQLAHRLLAESANDAGDYVRRVLSYFGNQGFAYTLTPPRLDFDSVDDFLFNTRRGFCGHFASAFTTLMREAGIPARVVTGYQGGELNRWAGYYIVRQSDAHAWSEIWLPARGWVRVDPTAVVAPERIERGLLEALADDEPVSDRLLRTSPWLAELRFAWDALNTAWRDTVLEFGAESQASLLERLGLSEEGWQALAVLLALALIVAMGVLLLQLTRELRGRHRDPVLIAYQRFCRRLERVGLRRLPHEGPIDFARRVAGLRPDLAANADGITLLYRVLRYEPAAESDTLSELQRRVRQFHPRRSR